MFEPTPEELDDGNWYLSLVLPEQVDEVAVVMMDDGASYEEVGNALVPHFQTNDDRLSNTTVFKFANTDGAQLGTIVVTDHGDGVDATAKVYGLPEHEAVDDVIDREMLRRGVDDYEVIQ